MNVHELEDTRLRKDVITVEDLVRGTVRIIRNRQVNFTTQPGVMQITKSSCRLLG
jgi:hypothetical protein